MVVDEEIDNMKVSKMLKMTGNLSEIAERCGISRPTLYKYMEMYDMGETDQIPEEILTLFNDVTSDEENKVMLKKKMENELIKDKREIEETKMMIDNLICEREKLRNRYEGRQHLDSDEARMLNDEYRDIESRIDQLSHNLRRLNEKRAELNRSFKTIESEDRAEEADDDTYAIDTRCMYEKGTFMIAFNDPDSDGCEHVLSLMTKFGNEYKTIGTYDTVKGKDFFMIDDIIYSPYLFYTVNRVETDADSEKVIDKENSSKISKFKR